MFSLYTLFLLFNTSKYFTPDLKCLYNDNENVFHPEYFKSKLKY